LFDFKTLFVNATNKKDAMDFFWKNFDANGYSIYNVLYEKAEGEGVKLFLTSNLMNGFLQRLDHFRKYAFAVHGVYGEEGCYEIRGVWVWRGNGLPKEITDLDSFEYHKWIRLDASKEEDRKKVDEYWCGLDEDVDKVEGLTARTVKYFK
jgi:elongation factor 1-gamma